MNYVKLFWEALRNIGFTMSFVLFPFLITALYVLTDLNKFSYLFVNTLWCMSLYSIITEYIEDKKNGSY